MIEFQHNAAVKIVLAGAGGTGSYLAQQLYRIAYARKNEIQIILCDGDVVSEKNLLRQHFTAQDVGKNKAEVLSKRYAQAFGMEAVYIPRFLESAEELYQLLLPNKSKVSFSAKYGKVIQQVILIGAVDNNRTRKLFHEVFERLNDIVYIDAGNEEFSGQVVCGVRQNGKEISSPAAERYPNILSETGVFPSEESCADRAVSAPQSISANVMASAVVTAMLYNLLFTGKLDAEEVVFSCKSIEAQSYQGGNISENQEDTAL